MCCLQKIAQLPSLTELNLSTCPVCRKQLYRPTLIKKFPALRLLDAKDVTLEERERTEVRPTTANRVMRPAALALQFSFFLRAKVSAMLTALLAPLSAQLLFSSEPRNSPTFATDSKYVLSTKVPIKLTSMNFEALTVRQPPVPLGGDAGQMMPDGRQLPADWQQQYQSKSPIIAC